VPEEDARWVADPQGLAEIEALGREHGIVALDLESNGFHAYHERVCLLQVRVADRSFVVDGLALHEHRPLAGLLREPGITKILHGSEFDVLLLKRELQIPLRGLYDTMHAARILGERGLSLDKLVAREFDVRLDKSFQRHDWARRPVLPAALHYAALDVRYLHELRALQLERLERRKLLPQARAAFAKIERMVPKPRIFDPQGARRLTGYERLDPQAKRALHRLFVLREQIAEGSDRAPFRVLNPETLVRLARERPCSAQALRQARGVPQWLPAEWGAAVLAALNGPDERPGSPAAEG